MAIDERVWDLLLVATTRVVRALQVGTLPHLVRTVRDGVRDEGWLILTFPAATAAWLTAGSVPLSVAIVTLPTLVVAFRSVQRAAKAARCRLGVRLPRKGEGQSRWEVTS